MLELEFMNKKYFLYLDILGFTDLVENHPNKIDDLYEVIASLNVHSHPSFKVVVFSDTVLVYNLDDADTTKDSNYIVMFLCEFVQDFMHRLMGRNIQFRAIITYGDFTHYELNGIPCFWGKALIDAYNSEKEIKAIGLFIHKDVSRYCNTFKFKEFNNNYNFVYVTQALDELERYGRDGYPISSNIIEWTGSQWFILPELNHISEMYIGANNVNYHHSVKAKYNASWKMYCKHYPNITGQLIQSGQDLKSFSPQVDWGEVFNRHPQDFKWAIKSKKKF